MSLGFKLVQKLAGFVVSAYEKEAQRLHAKVASVEGKRGLLLKKIDNAAQELERKVRALEHEHNQTVLALQEQEQAHADSIDGHVAAAAAATDKAVIVAKAVR